MVDMGWVNYIVIPKFKMIIETSRYVDEDSLDFIENAYTKLLNVLEDFNSELLHENLQSIDLSDFADMITITRQADIIFSDFHIDYLLLLWLKKKGIEFEIISEFEYEKQKSKYKNYIIYR